MGAVGNAADAQHRRPYVSGAVSVGGAGDWFSHLFENYTRRMFQRRTEVAAYTPEQTLHWLIWLARSLIQNDLSVFYVERMQPDWLPSRAQRWIVAVLPVIFFGLVVGPVGGLVYGLVVGLVSRRNRITPAEALRWSWRRARQFSVVGLVVGLVAGLVAALLSGLKHGLSLKHELGIWLPAGLVFGLVIGLFFGVFGGLTTDQIVTRTIPNEGIRRSLRNALISFLTVGLVGGLVFFELSGRGLVFELFLFGPESGPKSGLESGLIGGLISGLVNGGSACLKHYTLRFLLYCNKCAPLNYIRFLDYATERVFLRKVGGGYIFTHRLLMEHFATLQPTPVSTDDLPVASPTHRSSAPG